MSKTSIDYSEIAGLSVTLNRIKCKSDKSNEELLVEAWLSNRLSELKNK